MRPLRHISAAVVAAGVLAWACAAPAADDREAKPERAEKAQTRPDSRPALGTVARQLRLQMSLRKQARGTLETTLAHNRGEWERLSPDQRDRFRREAYAFLQKNPHEQERLLEYYAQFIEMSAERQAAYRERARWLAVVIESFSPAERLKLQELPPDQRAKMILDRKAELIAQGKLVDESASAPSSQPAP